MPLVMINLLAAIAGQVSASLPPDLVAAMHGYDVAQVKGDRTALSHWLADDYLLVNSRGALENKQDLIRDYTAPGFALEPFTVVDPVEKVWTHGAVLGGIVTLRGTDSGKRFEVKLRFADIWAKRAGHWQVVYTQVNRAP